MARPVDGGRRRFLIGGLASGGALVAGVGAFAAGRRGPSVVGPSDPTTATSPSTSSVAADETSSASATALDQEPAASGPRLIADGAHFPDGFVVPPGETWALASGARVTTGGNVVVQGVLALDQPDPEQTMSLTFVDVDESQFVGGDTQVVLPTDVGLWVIGEGRLEMSGAPKTSWTRLTGGVDAGATTLSVADASGWRVGDELAVTATVSSTVAAHWRQSDRVRITAVDGGRVEIDPPLSHDHPLAGDQWTAEVINLTRSVVIEGTPDHKAHVIHLHQGSTAGPGFRAGNIRHAEFRHLGPTRHNDRGETSSVLGRYPLHWHHGRGSTDGVTVEGVAVHDCGSHAYVPHSSDGIVFLDCASHDTLGDAYWWDPGHPSDFVTYDGCIASNVLRDGNERFKTNGFFAAKSEQDQSCAMRNCVATGVEGPDSAGFFWDNGSVGVWVFEDCLAHNIEHNGMRVWQNTALVHPIDRFSAYGCRVGVSHGAYANPYQYRGGRLHDCGTGLLVSAVTKAEDKVSLQEFHDVAVTDCARPLRLADGPVDAHRKTDFRRCQFGEAVLEASHADSSKHWEFVDCGLTPANFRIEQTQGSIKLRLQSGGEAWELGGDGGWSAIAPFD